MSFDISVEKMKLALELLVPYVWILTLKVKILLTLLSVPLFTNPV